MASMYPQELIDLDNSLISQRACFLTWLRGTTQDKEFAVHMSEYLEISQKDMASFKARYRREAKVILEMAGEKT